MINADQLLRQNSLPELRNYCETLEKDALMKAGELKMMVGSRYHDFIQSADAIATMEDQVSQESSQIV